jgi:hypothetical protein
MKTRDQHPTPSSQFGKKASERNEPFAGWLEWRTCRCNTGEAALHFRPMNRTYLESYQHGFGLREHSLGFRSKHLIVRERMEMSSQCDLTEKERTWKYMSVVTANAKAWQDQNLRKQRKWSEWKRYRSQLTFTPSVHGPLNHMDPCWTIGEVRDIEAGRSKVNQNGLKRRSRLTGRQSTWTSMLMASWFWTEINLEDINCYTKDEVSGKRRSSRNWNDRFKNISGNLRVNSEEVHEQNLWMN